METRICTKCKIFKTWFHFTRTRTICKECARIVAKEQHIKNRDKILKKRKEQRLTER